MSGAMPGSRGVEWSKLCSIGKVSLHHSQILRVHIDPQRLAHQVSGLLQLSAGVTNTMQIDVGANPSLQAAHDGAHLGRLQDTQLSAKGFAQHANGIAMELDRAGQEFKWRTGANSIMRGAVVVGDAYLGEFEQFIKTDGQRFFAFGVHQSAAYVMRVGAGGALQPMKEGALKCSEKAFNIGTLGRFAHGSGFDDAANDG